MKTINEIQDAVIYDQAAKVHDELTFMYSERMAIALKHKEELKRYDSLIKTKESQVELLCENRLKLYRHEKTNHLVMDLTD